MPSNYSSVDPRGFGVCKNSNRLENEMIMKRVAILLVALLVLSHQAFANLSRVRITPENQKEHEVNFTLTVKEQENDVYLVELHAPIEDKLKDLFGVGLFVGDNTTDTKGLILDVQLQQKSKWEKDDVCALLFRLNKAMLPKSILYLRCGNGSSEGRYEVALAKYLEPK